MLLRIRLHALASLFFVALTTVGCREADKGATTIASSGGAALAATTISTVASGGATTATVKTTAPHATVFKPRIEMTGNLKPSAAAPLAFLVPGTLERVNVKRGQHVAMGSVLAVLDAAAAQASLAQADAGVAAAEAQLRLAEDALARTTTIQKEEGGVSAAQVQQAESQRDLAAAQLLGSKAQGEQARVLLRNHSLKAPFDGTVIRVPDGVGFTVNPAVPLFVVEATRTLTLETSVTQEEASDLRVGMAVRVAVAATGEATPALGASDKDADAEKARIQVIVPSVDAATNRVPIEIAVPNANGRFFAHAFARAEIVGGERPAWRVPSAALTQSQGAFAAWTMGREGLAHATRVRVLGDSAGSAVVVPSDATWSAEIRLVVAPPLGLSEGAVLTEVTTP